VDYPIRNPTHYLLAKLTGHYSRERGLMRVLPQSNKLASKSGFREQFALMSGNTDREGPRNVISSIGYAFNVRGSASHQAAMVGANIPNAAVSSPLELP